ncbi:MAG TPA: alpha-E domain-containing protein, partial [Cytophagales bacterium]|nr:alpha-E domain-containing protein [Cytophagales bacterium]
WMSRYIERTDGILRMLKINYASSQDLSGEFTWRPVLKIFSYLEDSEIAKIERNNQQVLRFMIVDSENPNSVANMITRSRENARSVQDHITKEVWQCLNEFYHFVNEEKLERMLKYEDPITMLDALIRQGMLYYGTTEITMARGEGMCFMNIGKYLERAIQSADILLVNFKEESDPEKITDPLFWKYFLLSISGYELYLKNYSSGFEAKNILEQVIFNINFPRSIHYSVQQVHRYFERLKNEKNHDSFDKINFMIGKLKSNIQFSNIELILKEGLPVYLNRVHNELYAVGNALNQNYFAYS